MTPMRLASIFTVLDTYGVQDIIRAQSSVNPLDPPSHSTAVWVSPADWLSVYDSIFYATDEVPQVRASMDLRDREPPSFTTSCGMSKAPVWRAACYLDAEAVQSLAC